MGTSNKDHQQMKIKDDDASSESLLVSCDTGKLKIKDHGEYLGGLCYCYRTSATNKNLRSINFSSTSLFLKINRGPLQAIAT